MSAGTKVQGRSAAVIFSTRFGTTEVIARAIEQGLRESGMQTLCASAEGVAPGLLESCDLICLGSPTEVFSASKPMKAFLRAMGETNLGGKLGFAFDTKYDSRVSGSAAKYIEHALDDQGLHLVANRESAIVSSQKEGGRITGALLRDGEEERFEQIGLRIGRATQETLAKLQSP